MLAGFVLDHISKNGHCGYVACVSANSEIVQKRSARTIVTFFLVADDRACGGRVHGCCIVC